MLSYLIDLSNAEIRSLGSQGYLFNITHLEYIFMLHTATRCSSHGYTVETSSPSLQPDLRQLGWLRAVVVTAVNKV